MKLRQFYEKIRPYLWDDEQDWDDLCYSDKVYYWLLWLRSQF